MIEYYESINNRKFQFYSQLIKRYRNIIAVKKLNYLLLTPSNLKRNEYFRKGENVKIINNSIIFNNTFDQLTAEKKIKSNNYNHYQIVSNESRNLSTTNEATDKIIEERSIKHSSKLAQPLRSYLLSVSTATNLQGEMIPMACSSF
jgi:hypothetical protein